MNVFKILLLTVLIASVSGEALYSQTNNSSETGTAVLNSINADRFHVVIDDNFDDVINMSSGDSLNLKEGIYRLRLIKKYHEDIEIRYQAISDSTHNFIVQFTPFESKSIHNQKLRSSYPRLVWKSNAIIVSDYDSEIFVEDEIYYNQFVLLDRTGKHNVTVTNVHLNITQKLELITDSSRTFQVFEHYIRPDKNRVRKYAAIPGSAQLYKGEKLKGYTIGLTTFASLFASAYSFNRYYSLNNEYERKISLYDLTSDEMELKILGNEIFRLNDKLRTYGIIRDTGLVLGVLIYAFNIYDALQPPKSGFRIEFDPYLNFPNDNEKAFTISTKFNF